MNIEEKINEIARNMNPIDDIFFRKMAEYLPFCEEILQVILADKKLKVIEGLPQFHGTNLQGRSVIFDLKCTLGTGEEVDVEVQKADDDDHQRRVRYNGAVLTTNITDTGKRFADVPDVIVVYISRFDIFASGKTVYHVRRVVEETGAVVENGFREIYVNAAIDDGSDVAELMKVFMQNDSYSEKFPITSARKKQFKLREDSDMNINEELEKLYAMSTEKGRKEGLKKGRQEGRQEGKKEGLKEGKKEGLKEGRRGVLADLVKEGIISITVAAKKAGMTEEAFRKMAML